MKMPRNVPAICGHDRPIMARGMCRSCYRRHVGELIGPPRVKRLAWLCEHLDRPNHSKGFCEPCSKKALYFLDVEKSRERSRLNKIRNPPDREKHRRTQRSKYPNYCSDYYRSNKSAILLKMTCTRYGINPEILNKLFEDQESKMLLRKRFWR